MVPAVYRARRVAAAGSPAQTRQARSASAFRSRRSRACRLAGGSIAINANTCNRWDWIMSTRAPAPS